MKITILNGEMKTESNLSPYLEKLAERLQDKHTCFLYPLGKMNLQYCKGCWSCWWKTPGRCAIHDDAEKIFRSVINSDFVIFASPLIAGFTSSVLKKITDRYVVIGHPYFELVNGECHHQKRYDKYPDIGLILEKETDTDDEDISIVKDIYDRIALNFHCERKFIRFTDETKIEDLISLINMNFLSA